MLSDDVPPSIDGRRVKRLFVWSYVAIFAGVGIPFLGLAFVLAGLGHPPALLATSIAAIPLFGGFYLRRRAQEMKGSQAVTIDEVAAALVSKTINSVQRVYYVYEGSVDTSDGDLTLSFHDDTLIRFNSGPDGESVRIVDSPWLDLFAGHLSEENRRYVEEYGKWTAFDVSTAPEVSPFIGARVIGVERFESADGKFNRCVIATTSGTIEASAAWDQLTVSFFDAKDG